MRITTMKQMARRVSSGEPGQDVEAMLERVKWYLWHGNVFCALQVLKNLETDFECYEDSPDAMRKLGKAVAEFRGYISTNRSFIPNYADRYRYGEIISTAFVESTVNEVVSRRMVKKQQMRWTKRGAHLLLQVRIQVLNNDWRETFCRWYPEMTDTEDQVASAA